MKVVRLNKSVVVGLFYVVNGGSMASESSELSKVYIADSREEIEQVIREEHKISGDLKEWLNRSWSSLIYYDNQADAERAVIENTPPDQPTRVRTTQDAVAALDYETPFLKFNNVHYPHAPAKLGIHGDLKQGVSIPKGTEFTVPFAYARFLINTDEPKFEIVEQSSST